MFYGQHSTTKINNVVQFLKNIGFSSWWKLTTQYTFPSTGSSAGLVQYRNHFVDSQYSYGGIFDEETLEAYIEAWINSGKTMWDTKGIYLVLFDDIVYVDGIGTDFCGKHGSFSLAGQSLPILYAYIGSELDCLACDATIYSVIAHELTETVTNPYSGAEAYVDNCGI